MKRNVLTDMTWKEVVDVKDKVKLAIIPVGSTEQHGPHLPLQHDVASVLYVAKRLAKELYPNVLVTPAISFGVSYHHMHFPGTISVKPETLMSLIFDVCENLVSHGFRKILILNGHGGNFETLSVAAITANRRLGVDVFFANYWDFLPKQAYKLIEDEVIPGHSADFETSIALHIYPKMVRTDLVKDSDHVESKLSNAEKILIEKSRMYRLMFEKSSSGVPRGNPTLATAKKGEVLLNVIVSELVSFVETIINAT